jgi:hypothetical protein
MKRENLGNYRLDGSRPETILLIALTIKFLNSEGLQTQQS